jgi:hypothetical protein
MLTLPITTWGTYPQQQAAGLRVLRTWAFNTGLPRARASYDARQLAGLDYGRCGQVIDVVWLAGCLWGCKQQIYLFMGTFYNTH